MVVHLASSFVLDVPRSMLRAPRSLHFALRSFVLCPLSSSFLKCFLDVSALTPSYALRSHCHVAALPHTSSW